MRRAHDKLLLSIICLSLQLYFCTYRLRTQHIRCRTIFSGFLANTGKVSTLRAPFSILRFVVAVNWLVAIRKVTRVNRKYETSLLLCTGVLRLRGPIESELVHMRQLISKSCKQKAGL